MIERADYAVAIRSTGPHRGIALNDTAGLPPLELSAPPEFGGPPGIWSPEHLFVASVASCFMTTFMAIANLSKLEVAELDVPAEGTIERGDDRRYRFTRLVLRPLIVLADGASAERAERIVRKAEDACLISRSIATPIVVEPVIQAAGVPVGAGLGVLTAAGEKPPGLAAEICAPPEGAPRRPRDRHGVYSIDPMCRWLAYSGAPIFLEDLLFRPEHSLIDQSLAARTDETTTNGDGFGIGWYGEREMPGLYKDTRPAWNDDNLHDLAANIRSRLFFAHVRSATSGIPVQQSNCHPFRSGRWLFMHNGFIEGFPRLRRELLLAIDPELFAGLRGSTDSEIMFFLALTFGLEDDPIGSVERMAGFVEAAGRAKGIEAPLQMTLGISDGRRIFAFRYSSRGRSKNLFHSLNHDNLRELNPALPRGTYAIVSEPLTDLSEQWERIPEGSVVTVFEGEIERRPFVPRAD